MPPAIDVPEFVTVKDIASRLHGDPASPPPVTSAEIWSCWLEIDGLPADKRTRLANQRLLSSPSWEADAGQLSMVLKILTAWSDAEQLWLVVGTGASPWRIQVLPTATTCDYATPCQQRPQVRRRLVGVAGCCRKSKHVGADASSITSFAADTRTEFQAWGRDIVFAVNQHDLKAGAFPHRDLG